MGKVFTFEKPEYQIGFILVTPETVSFCRVLNVIAVNTKVNNFKFGVAITGELVKFIFENLGPVIGGGDIKTVGVGVAEGNYAVGLGRFLYRVVIPVV